MVAESQFENAVFRYRSIDALLGDREELERQSIYFSPPELLNDPMEGFRQQYWRGDRITWRNLLRHYVICLHNRLFEALLTENDKPLDSNSIAVFQNLNNFPTPQARSLCEECITEIEGSELHASLLDLLASMDRDISYSELYQHLRSVHIDWLADLHDVFSRHGLVTRTLSVRPQSDKLANLLRIYRSLMPDVREQIEDAGLEILSEIQQMMSEQMSLLIAYKNTDVTNPKKESLFFEFPAQYLDNLMRLVFPPWYVACFSTRPDNAAMWSYYAGNHSGCCLIFKTEGEEASRKLKLLGPNGYGSNGVSRSFRRLPLNAVRYSAGEQRLEFFRNIGRLNHRDTMQGWFQDETGKTSPLADHLNSDRQEDWRKAYWENFSPPLLRKLPDWEHEQEHRIILDDILNLHDTHEGRIFTYDYDTLGGIIFGINVSFTNKVRIMRIVDKKLSIGSIVSEFNFYQARYISRAGKMEVQPLNLLRHES